MQSCSILGCESYKYARTKNITYFKFPLNDEVLLKEWLRRIDRQDWSPSWNDQICSAHFQKEDIDNHQGPKYPRLKSTAIPLMFPSKPISDNPMSPAQIVPDSYQKQVIKLPGQQTGHPSSERLIQLDRAMVQPTPIRNVTTASGNVIKLVPVTHNELHKILPNVNHIAINKNESSVKDAVVNTGPRPKTVKSDLGVVEEITDYVKTNTISAINIKRPILKITINKRYNNNVVKQYTNKRMTLQQNKGKTEDTHPININKTEDKCCLNNESDPKRTLESKAGSSNESPRHLVSKAQHGCDTLRKRLDAPKEERKNKQDKINSSQTYLDVSYHNSDDSTNLDETGPKRKRVSMALDGTQGQEEYENLLKDVRQIKDSLLNSKPYIRKTRITVNGDLNQLSDINEVETSLRRVDNDINISNTSSVCTQERFGDIIENEYEIIEVTDEELSDMAIK